MLSPRQITSQQTLYAFLNGLEQRAQDLQTASAQLLFQQYQTKRRPLELEAVEAEQAALMTNPEYQEVAERFAGQVDDPLLARRLEVWRRAFRNARVSAQPEVRQLVNEISDEIVRHQYVVAGQPLSLGQVRDVLRKEQDRGRRRAAWESFAPLSRKLESRSRRLFHMRNQLARGEGFSTYAHMQLAEQGLALERVTAILHELADASQPTYRKILEEGAEQAGLTEIQPWDIKFLLDGEGGLPAAFFPRDEIHARLREWGQDHGLNIDRLGISVHFMDIPFNGLCVTVNPQDIRILGNMADGHNYYKTAFHELGHGLHSAFSNPGSFMLRREPSVFSEGMAELLGYTVNDRAWLAHVRVGQAEIAAAGARAMGPWFAYLRQRSAHALFEYAAYANPDGDLDGINAEIESRILDTVCDPSPRWAAEPNAWYSRYPVYWQNYVLADVIASQIHHDLRRRFGHVWRNADAIAYIREQYWAPGGAVDWQEKLRRGTGEDLNTRALVLDLQG